MTDFDYDWAIAAGGWDPRYAVTLAVVAEGDIAAALIDTNGDGGSIDLDEYRRAADGTWVAGSSGGGAGERGLSWSGDMVAAYGRTAAGSTVQVEYVGHSHEVIANDNGWWLFIAPTADEESLPTPSA